MCVCVETSRHVEKVIVNVFDRSRLFTEYVKCLDQRLSGEGFVFFSKTIHPLTFIFYMPSEIIKGLNGSSAKVSVLLVIWYVGQTIIVPIPFKAHSAITNFMRQQKLKFSLI